MNDSKAIAQQNQPQIQSLAKVETGNFARRPGPMSIAEIREWGQMFFESGMFENVKSAAQAMVRIKAGEELGFAPFASMSGVHIIKGKPSLGATLQASLIKDSPHYRYRVHALNRDVCKLEFFEKSDGKWSSIGFSEFTQADAKLAGLAGDGGQNKDMYRKYGPNMLFSRALTNGMRWYTPDLLRSCDSNSPSDDGFDVDAIVAETSEPAPPVEQLAETVTIEGEVVDTTTGEVIEPDDERAAIEAESDDAPLFTGEEASLIDLRTAVTDVYNSTKGESRARANKLLGVRTIGALSKTELADLLTGLESL